MSWPPVCFFSFGSFRMRSWTSWRAFWCEQKVPVSSQGKRGISMRRRKRNRVASCPLRPRGRDLPHRPSGFPSPPQDQRLDHREMIILSYKLSQLLPDDSQQVVLLRFWCSSTVSGVRLVVHVMRNNKARGVWHLKKMCISIQYEAGLTF